MENGRKRERKKEMTQSNTETKHRVKQNMVHIGTVQYGAIRGKKAKNMCSFLNCVQFRK